MMRDNFVVLPQVTACPIAGSQQQIFYAISEPRRRYLLETLRVGPRSVNSLADEMTISRPAVSQHLKILLDANLVKYRKSGTKRIYYYERGSMEDVYIWCKAMR